MPQQRPIGQEGSEDGAKEYSVVITNTLAVLTELALNQDIIAAPSSPSAISDPPIA